ncbi:MAG: PEP-CTERM sorting domain-containing protein [Synechococcales cyanobacterium T60_A2020_003]|nr:PEP-CTERM sorting domain-containing protein [Synechococcales cyanobacterium T60_A2020_003]
MRTLQDHSQVFRSARNTASKALKVRGTDAIFLAGRLDVTIPPLGSSSSTFPLTRHGTVRSDFLRENFPKSIPVKPRKTLKFKAKGAIDFFNGTSAGYGPDGGAPQGTSLFGIAGISGYDGPTGGLVGVFLSDENPKDTFRPKSLNFTPTGLGTGFKKLSPELGQVFFIGDGRRGTGVGNQQKFVAPKGATRLFFGIADGFGFVGKPGYYEDNDGFYKVSITRL